MAHTLSLHRLAAADPSDRTTSVLLRIGAAVLAVGLVAFGLLYYKDQHVASAPSLVERQVALTEAAVRKSPDDLQARLQLGEVYGQAARYDDAVTQFDQVLKVAPDSKDALLGKGFALMTKGELDKAAVPLTRIVKATRKGEFAGADSQLAAAYYYLGVIAVKQHKPDVALTQLGHALKIEPTDSDAMYQVGVAQLQKGANVEAIATFRNALRFVPTGWCEPYQQMQAAYTAMKKPELATYASAMAGFCGGKVDQARTQLTTLTAGPAAVDAMLGLGLIAETSHDTKAAGAWYQKALTKDPKNMAAISSLAGLGVKPAAPPPRRRRSEERAMSDQTQSRTDLLDLLDDMSAPPEPPGPVPPVDEAKRRRRRIILAVVLALLVLLVGLFTWYLLNRKPLSELPGLSEARLPTYKTSFYDVAKPLGVAVSPDGSRIYATQSGSPATTLVFDRDGAKVGELIPPAKPETLHVPVYVAVDPSTGRRLRGRPRGGQGLRVRRERHVPLDVRAEG